MSVFTNPASGSIEHAKAYTAAIVDLLGTADLMEVLRMTPSKLRDALNGMSPAEMARPEASGKWSARHVVQHLADSDLVCSYRFRMVLAEDRPPLTGYDQDLWAGRLHYDLLHLRQVDRIRRAVVGR